jgi:hypothetical protein
MNTTSREELIELGRGREEICVSIYTSVDVADQGKAAATIRLKNHFPMIEASLAKRGVGPAEIKKILRPIHQLAQQRLADLPPCHGLAMFVTEHSCRSEPLPIEVDDVAWVGRRFYVRPLLGLLRRDRGYWLLSVSQNRARLFHGSANGLVEQALQDLPLGVTDVVDESSHDGTRQAHTARQGGTIRQDAEYHGQGGLADHKKLNIEKYLRAVDRSIEPLLRSDPLPLVFAGVDYLYPMFAELTQCSQILSEHIHGNPDLVSPAQLHERACAILKPFFDRRQSETLVRLNAMQGRPLASDSVHEILPAAADGRVQSLLVHDTGPLWGAFDPVRRTVHAETEQLPDSEDLIDRACVEVLDHGGEVFAVSWQELKSGAPMSAILRYENAATPVLPATV